MHVAPAMKARNTTQPGHPDTILAGLLPYGTTSGSLCFSGSVCARPALITSCCHRSCSSMSFCLTFCRGPWCFSFSPASLTIFCSLHISSFKTRPAGVGHVGITGWITNLFSGSGPDVAGGVSGLSSDTSGLFLLLLLAMFFSC